MTQPGPHIFDVELGPDGKCTVAFCTCGASATAPRCDGSHKGTEAKPHIETFQEARRVAICACGRTSKPPYCDGSHGKTAP